MGPGQDHRRRPRPAPGARLQRLTRQPAVLFDLDGTLTDPYEGISRCIAHALTGLGLPVPDDLRAFVGPPLQEGVAALGLSPEQVDEAVRLYRERFTKVGLYENRVYDGVPELLAGLREAGVRLGVATSKPEPFAVRIVEHFRLGPFDVVAGATLDGSRSAKADVVAHALRTLAARTLVGDRVQDVDGARAHGLRAIGVSWGFAEPGELDGADVVVDTPAALRTLLLT